MRCPDLPELPSPPPGEIGFPWTAASARVPDEKTCPRISIVTPSYNQGKFLEETIRSVLLQGYPNLEYIVVDGGSTDDSVEIIRKYARWLTFWVSERDAGQSDAINKGWRRCTGDWRAWINSDDRYLPDAFARAMEVSLREPSVDLIFGDLELLLSDSSHIVGYPVRSERMLAELALPFQPTCFFKHSILEKVGTLDVSLHYVMDMDLLLRVMANTDWLYLPNALASFRIQSGTKTSTAEAYFAREMFVLLERVLSQRVAYPKLQHLNAPTLRCIFYRRASKHYYMAGHFRESAALIAQAVRLNPRMFFSIAQDEGVGWLVRRLTPPWVYRRLGAFYRTKKNA